MRLGELRADFRRAGAVDAACIAREAAAKLARVARCLGGVSARRGPGPPAEASAGNSALPYLPVHPFAVFPQRYRRDPGADGAELRNSRSSPPEVCPVCAGAEFGSGPNFVMAAGSGGVVDSLAGSYRVVEVPAVCLFG